MRESDLRILIIDDNPSIHQDFIKILTTIDANSDFEALDSQLFGEKPANGITLPKFKIDTASQGQEGVEKIKQALEENYPYALAFVDIRMPPGWDGIETIKHIWELDPNIQIVICTAYSDYTWEETVENLGITDNLLILKKPFDSVTVRQLACALVKKWQLTQDLKRYTDFLERNVQQRTQSLQESLSLIRATIESSTDGILVTNLDGKIVDYNSQFIKMWEIPPAVINYKEMNVVLNHMSRFLQAPDEFIKKAQETTQKINDTDMDTIVLKDGRIFERYSQPHLLGENPVGRVWSFRDITKKYYLEQKLEYQATHDELTGLPNRVLFHDRIKQGIANSLRNKSKLGVLFLDLDRFKLINDSLSHGAGDELLKAVAKRLKALIRNEDTIARLGGDEFVAVIPNIKTNDDVFLIARKFIEAFKEPFKVSDRLLCISTSIGISVYPDDGQTVDELLRGADIAMYQAKEGGKNQFFFYTKAMNEEAMNRLDFEDELRNALKNQEFFLSFQAQQNSTTGQIMATEALIRWNHPTRGVLLPIDFIPQAEAAGLLVSMGEWVLKTACKQNKKWQDSGLPPVRVAVNVTAVQLKQPSFVETVKNALNEAGLNPQYLELEITESVIVSSVEVLHTVQAIRALGIKIALDDFGTGNSSLTYLRKASIDRLKIDRSIIENIAVNANDEIIIKSIIALARSMHLEVIAEGVETSKQLKFLQREDCRDIQGYFFSKPLTPIEFSRLLQENGSLKSSKGEKSPVLPHAQQDNLHKH